MIALAFLAASLLSRPSSDPGQTFELKDYRWVPVSVRQTPTAVDCRYEVVDGRSTVHMELLDDQNFWLFAHHRDYETLASAEGARTGAFQRMIESPGRYRVLVRNNAGAPPVTVSLSVSTEVDPPASISLGLPPRRQAGIIAASLAVFFGTVLWSGRKLLRAYRQKSNRPDARV